MPKELRNILKAITIETSAPCRIDMGGTLDLSTFYLPLRRYRPCTFNMALGLRTTVRISAFEKGKTQIVSKGFPKAEFAIEKAPFDHPLGLMFAIANYFGADGVRIQIDSASPPRSALGGSSSAAVALIGAFARALAEDGAPSRSADNIALLAHALEGSVAGVPCGLQDHLAAVYGGVNAWCWPETSGAPPFSREPVLASNAFKDVQKHILVAYCGVPHVSSNINSRWVEQFLTGKYRRHWIDICRSTREFIAALADRKYTRAANCMNREVVLRREMTPDVLDEIGVKLTTAALDNHCGARFTGAGGGGCLWALGELEDIDRLKRIWENILQKKEDACLLDSSLDGKGVISEIIDT